MCVQPRLNPAEGMHPAESKPCIWSKHPSRSGSRHTYLSRWLPHAAGGQARYFRHKACTASEQGPESLGLCRSQACLAGAGAEAGESANIRMGHPTIRAARLHFVVLKIPSSTCFQHLCTPPTPCTRYLDMHPSPIITACTGSVP